MKPSVVVELLRDPSKVACRLIRLRDRLPYANVSLLAANLPDVLLQVSYALNARSFGCFCLMISFPRGAPACMLASARAILLSYCGCVHVCVCGGMMMLFSTDMGS